MSPRSVLINFWGSFYCLNFLYLSLPAVQEGRAVVFILVLGLSAP